jgi:hypothetical protein
MERQAAWVVIVPCDPLNHSPYPHDRKESGSSSCKHAKKYLLVVEMYPGIIRECPSHHMQVVPQHHQQPYLYENQY